VTADGKTCLVLGAKGFVGSAVAAEALRREWRLIAVDKDDYALATGARCDLLINANGNSKKYLAAADPKLEFDLSVRSVEQSLHDFAFDRYVHLSSIDVYNDPSSPGTSGEDAAIDPARLTPYGFHKWLAERLVDHGAPRRLILRMGGFVGPGLWKNSIHDLLSGSPLRVHPDSAYQYLDTRELARIVFDLIDLDPADRPVNVCGDGVVTPREAAGWIPGLDPAALPSDGPQERYEVSIRRLLALRPGVPASRDTVRAFIREVLDARRPPA